MLSPGPFYHHRHSKTTWDYRGIQLVHLGQTGNHPTPQFALNGTTDKQLGRSQTDIQVIAAHEDRHSNSFAWRHVNGGSAFAGRRVSKIIQLSAESLTPYDASKR